MSGVSNVNGEPLKEVNTFSYDRGGTNEVRPLTAAEQEHLNSLGGNGGEVEEGLGTPKEPVKGTKHNTKHKGKTLVLGNDGKIYQCDNARIAREFQNGSMSVGDRGVEAFTGDPAEIKDKKFVKEYQRKQGINVSAKKEPVAEKKPTKTEKLNQQIEELNKKNAELRKAEAELQEANREVRQATEELVESKTMKEFDKNSKNLNAKQGKAKRVKTKHGRKVSSFKNQKEIVDRMRRGESARSVIENELAEEKAIREKSKTGSSTPKSKPQNTPNKPVEPTPNKPITASGNLADGTRKEFTYDRATGQMRELTEAELQQRTAPAAEGKGPVKASGSLADGTRKEFTYDRATGQMRELTEAELQQRTAPAAEGKGPVKASGSLADGTRKEFTYDRATGQMRELTEAELQQRIKPSSKPKIKAGGGKWGKIIGGVLAAAAVIGIGIAAYNNNKSDDKTREKPEVKPTDDKQTVAQNDSTKVENTPVVAAQDGKPAAAQNDSTKVDTPVVAAQDGKPAAAQNDSTKVENTPVVTAQDGKPAAVPSDSTRVENPEAVTETTTDSAETPAQAKADPIVVKAGDNLWNLCKAELKRKNGTEPTNAEILEAVGKMMTANNLHFESDGYRVLIYPEQELVNIL